MTDTTKNDDGAGEVTVEEGGDGREARTRRRALLILAAVVVVGIVAALVTWSVTSGSSAPAAGPTASASPSASGSDSDEADGEDEPAASESPEPEAPGGGVTDDIRDFDEEAPVGDDVTVALSDLESVEGEASMPGEIAGPALRFTVTFTNESDTAYELTSAVTNVYYGAELTPAIELQEPGGEPLPQEVAPGKSVTGVFVYNVPTEARDDVRIEVYYAAADPALLFEGAVPR